MIRNFCKVLALSFASIFVISVVPAFADNYCGDLKMADLRICNEDYQQCVSGGGSDCVAAKSECFIEATDDYEYCMSIAHGAPCDPAIDVCPAAFSPRRHNALDPRRIEVDLRLQPAEVKAKKL